MVFLPLVSDNLARSHHSDDRAAAEVRHKPSKEGPLRQVRVVGLRLGLGRCQKLESHQLVALLLEPRDHLTHQAPLDSVGLDGLGYNNIVR